MNKCGAGTVDTSESLIVEMRYKNALVFVTHFV